MRARGSGIRRLGLAGAFCAVLVLLLGASSRQAFAACGLPTVTSISPTSGSAGTVVTITGTEFCGFPTNTVKFGDTVATSVTKNSDTSLTAVAPPGSGTVHVTVTHGSGTSATSAADEFTYTGGDSTNIRSLQDGISPVVATTSGDAIGGAVEGGIDSAFSSNPQQVALNPSGVSLAFGAPPPERNKIDQAFSALGYAGVFKAPRRNPVRINDWRAFADVRGTGWDRDSVSLNGYQINATAGLGRLLTPDLLVGMLGGYEHFDYDAGSFAGTLKGDGWTVGSYLAWRFAGSLRFDAALAYSNVSYDAAAGTATGSFTGHRWLVSTGLTGRYGFGAFQLDPSLRLNVLREQQDGWTDSLGAAQPSRTFTAGRASAGAKLAYPWLANGAMTLSPYAGFYGDYRFSTDNAVVGQPVVSIDDGFAGRLTSGLVLAFAPSGTISLGGELGGIGADYTVWSVAGRGHLAF